MSGTNGMSETAAPPDGAAHRVLMVDDEPALLQALQRHLFLHDEVEWDLELCASGADALERLAAEPFDVVVTDLVMPGVTGQDVLEACIARHPGVARILFTGRVDFESAGSLLPLAHQFLTKPCDADTLVSVVTRAAGLREMVADEALRSLARGITSLPPSFRSFAALTQVLDDPRSSHGDLAEIIDGDPALAARVLHVANTVLFSGGRHGTSDVRAAVARLGTAMVRALALSVAASHPPDGRRLPRGFSVEGAQAHALRVGALAKKIAPTPKLRDAAGTAGLLHDVGTLLLASRRPEDYEAFLAAAAAPGADRLDEERRAFGATHAALGGYLLGIWGMPTPVVGAIGGHHDPAALPKGASRTLAAVVAVADVIAAGVEGRSPAVPDLTVALEVLGAGDEEVRGWRAWLDERGMERAA